MKLFETINSTHIIDIDISPNEGDIAIVSINNKGTLGVLNKFVLYEYGYTAKDLPNRNELKRGFSQIPATKRKAILFVVTVNEGDTSENLKENLYNALVEFRFWFTGRKLWIPLMGTGSGGLTLEESYSITANTINKFQRNSPTETIILLSIPDSQEGQELIKQIRERKQEKHLNIRKIFNEFNGKLYLAGSIWNRQDQLARFLEEGVWEKGREDKTDSKLIREVKKNDILIIKSTFGSGGISYLRIKALGIVIKNPEDGFSLLIDWKIKNISVDIEHLGFYRKTINEVATNDVTTILSKMDKYPWIEFFPTELINSKKEAIAGLISDSDRGTDYLDITKDVNAFARVIAAKSFEPPLAIALFGKWGSGKSFFMRKLKEQISKLSSNEPNRIYCEGIVHIHFNAWSYMDSNLWASIVTKIFEELSEYISENRKADIEKNEIEKLLTDKLSIAKEEIGILESKKESVVLQMKSLEEKRKEVTKELDEKINKVKSGTIWQMIEEADNKFNAREKIVSVLRDNDSYVKTEKDLKYFIPEKYWNDPERTYQIAKSKLTFLIAFFRKDKIKTNLIWLVIILSIIAFTPLILELFSLHISKKSFLLPQATLSLLVAGGAIWRRGEIIYNQLQPLIASFWVIKEDHESTIRAVKSKFEQEEKALELEIEKGKSEVLLIQEQIQKAETVKTDLDFRINNAFATEALYSFIERRSKSEDYKRHLGLISVIRKDFEILNDLFTDHNQEAEKIKDAKEFKEKFRKPLERIILYIDDLDRCPEDNVVQVLEAVNLLMAFPLFVVVVGVDSRWVKNALIKKHALQFAGTLNDNEATNSNLELIEPSNYLEKIFQIPFHLKNAENTNVREMIQMLAKSKAGIIEYIEDKNVEKEDGTDIIADTDKENTTSNTDISPSDVTGHIYSDKPEELILTDNEIALMQDMSEIIGNNPRAIKRFVNIYRIIKAHEEFHYETDSTNQELLAILFLLALPLGDYRKLLPSLEVYIEDERNSLKQLTLYMQPTYKIGDFNDLKHQLDVKLSANLNFEVLQRTNIGVLKKHNNFIRRFTFKQI